MMMRIPSTHLMIWTLRDGNVVSISKKIGETLCRPLEFRSTSSITRLSRVRAANDTILGHQIKTSYPCSIILRRIDQSFFATVVLHLNRRRRNAICTHPYSTCSLYSRIIHATAPRSRLPSCLITHIFHRSAPVAGLAIASEIESKKN